MSRLRTNRDLCLFVADLLEASANNARPLEDYLLALWRLASPHRSHDGLDLPTFTHLLEAALTEEPSSFESAWAEMHRYRDREHLVGFPRWAQTIAGQIVDLHEMAATGALADEYRYFGIDAPRGSRWFNFDPLKYLECAAAGTFEAWREGDPTARTYVPGPVAVLDDKGHITSADPREIPERTVELKLITWDLFARFLVCGQIYE